MPEKDGLKGFGWFCVLQQRPNEVAFQVEGEDILNLRGGPIGQRSRFGGAESWRYQQVNIDGEILPECEGGRPTKAFFLAHVSSCLYGFLHVDSKGRLLLIEGIRKDEA